VTWVKGPHAEKHVGEKKKKEKKRKEGESDKKQPEGWSLCETTVSEQNRGKRGKKGEGEDQGLTWGERIKESRPKITNTAVSVEK